MLVLASNISTLKASFQDRKSGDFGSISFNLAITIRKFAILMEKNLFSNFDNASRRLSGQEINTKLTLR